jgi:alpha-tubulin suppressor-like RCC1 family protein
MKVLRRSRRLVRLAGCTALALGMAAAAAAAAAPARAQARVTVPISQTHAVASWGSSRDGELGNGTTTGRTLYGDVTGLPSAAQISAGFYHTLALMPDGTVWAWGGNEFGQLGDGSTTNRSTPVRVMGLTGVIQVAAGMDQNVALRSDGTVWAWGRNEVGQVGNGVTSSYQLTPVRVTRLTGVKKISAGGEFSLALRSDGTVWAWGANQLGQLGNGTTANSSVPVKVAGLSQVTGISAGADASLATRSSGNTALTSVWAWGANNFGQLGDGTLAAHTTPEPVNGINTSFIAGIAAGYGYAAVLGADGSVWGWGNDRFGQLGNAPTAIPATRPVNTIGASSGITQLATGMETMLAVKSNGTVLAWGNNGAGQLGIGNTASIAGPVQVTGLTSATQVAAGRASCFAIHLVPLIIG